MNDIEKQVLELIGEDIDDPDVFTGTGLDLIRDSVNDAIEEVVMVTGANKRQYYIPLRAGQQFYRIQMQYGSPAFITDVWLTGKEYRLEQTGLIRVTRHDPRWMTTSADPLSYFCIGSDIIGLYPKPASSADMIEVTVVEIPERYDEDTDRIKLKSDFDEALVHFAVSEFWASRGDAKEAANHYTQYRRVLGLEDDFDQAPADQERFRSAKGPWPATTT